MSAKEAAERVRRINAGESYQSVYACEWVGGGFLDRDKNEIVDAYLAEHPADDGELITCNDGPWLVSLGGKQSGGCGNCYFFGDGVEVWLFDEHLRDKDDGQESVLDAGHRVSNPTRGQLRRLLDALGVTE